jgi:hypothetical protein
MDVRKLAARKQLSIVHVDKSQLFFDEFTTVMATKDEDFWVLRLDKLNKLLQPNMYSTNRGLTNNVNSQLWTKVALNLIH